MNKIKAIAVSLVVLLCGGQSYAHDNFNYLNVNVGGGLHTLRHNPSLGSSKPGFGGTFNVSYVHFFGKYAGLGTGLGVSYYSSSSKINGIDVLNEIDEINNYRAFEFRMNYTDWKEKQHIYDLELPLGFYNRGDFNDHTSFLVGIGGKLYFPFIYRYEVTEGTLEGTGYYPDENVTYGNMPHHGFGYAERESGSQNRRLGFAVYLDLGMNHWLSDRAALYWGLYCNYGISDLVKSHKASLYNYEGEYAGVHSSNMVNKVSMLAAGVKVGVTFAFGKKPEEPLADTVVVKDTVNLADQLVLQPVDSAAADSSWKDVADMISKLPDWDRFNYLNKPALEDATKAFAALSDSAKMEIPDNLRDKLLGLNANVQKSTIPNLEQSLKIKHSYGFAFSSSDGHFSEEQQSYMHFIADCLKMNPQAQISVIGYTCNVGTEDFNEVVGYDRAIHVRNYIVRFGAFEDQVIMDTRTSKNPVAPNDCESNRAKNRRTEINLIKK